MQNLEIPQQIFMEYSNQDILPSKRNFYLEVDIGLTEQPADWRLHNSWCLVEVLDEEEVEGEERQRGDGGYAGASAASVDASNQSTDNVICFSIQTNISGILWIPEIQID